MKKILISAQELANQMAMGKKIKILDTSLRSSVSNTANEMANGIIPRALKFDLDEGFSDSLSVFPHTLPSRDMIAESCQKLGLDIEDSIVVYDNKGIYSSPRAYWMLTESGFKDVLILNGGLKSWVESGYSIDDNFLAPDALKFCPNVNPISNVKNTQEIRDNLSSQQFTLIDARSSGRFLGTDPEPRKGLSNGSIPKSLNIPFANVLNGAFYLDAKQIDDVFAKKGIAKSDSLVFSCGSGITACIVLVAAKIAGFESTSLYDGSWSEWAADEKNEIVI